MGFLPKMSVVRRRFWEYFSRLVPVSISRWSTRGRLGRNESWRGTMGQQTEHRTDGEISQHVFAHRITVRHQRLPPTKSRGRRAQIGSWCLGRPLGVLPWAKRILTSWWLRGRSRRYQRIWMWTCFYSLWNFNQLTTSLVFFQWFMSVIYFSSQTTFFLQVSCWLLLTQVYKDGLAGRWVYLSSLVYDP